jgi:hypothetical protein
MTQSHLSTFERLSRAADLGELPLKEAVLLEAKVLYAPHLIPKIPLNALRPGEILGREDCLTGCYKDVHRVLPQLTPAEREWLGSLSLDLHVIVQTCLQGK